MLLPSTEQLADRSKPPVRLSSCFFSREASLRRPPYIRFVIAFHPDGDVRRTPYACTPNDVHTYTERRTHVRRTLYARTPSDVRHRFRLMAEPK